MSFNVIITLDPNRENINWAFSQINSCIGTSYIIAKVRSSLILLSVSEPYRFWFEVKKCLQGKDTPIHRVIPVDEVVDPIITKVIEKARNYALARIPVNASYRITLHGKIYAIDERGKLVKMHTIDAVKAIAEGIDRKVDLENPEWVVYIRTVPLKRWHIVATISVAKAIVFKNIRIGEPIDPL
ncbi:hypothetical protein QPL79_08080 [Ignisphaera sp. 4213-co]|uniref:THUMP domain-containing protein n=1 Tax=Ignisphaera cupida TaxID=3050454 RepID=A0ABD4ZB40_9CREN|nr:hypothetical protein [Ignisphaera sp. 4213-co]MDK6029318.1 hypothetical protein [Ignisphaera sp. 4213-co]